MKFSSWFLHILIVPPLKERDDEEEEPSLFQDQINTDILWSAQCLSCRFKLARFRTRKSYCFSSSISGLDQILLCWAEIQWLFCLLLGRSKHDSRALSALVDCSLDLLIRYVLSESCFCSMFFLRTGFHAPSRTTTGNFCMTSWTAQGT